MLSYSENGVVESFRRGYLTILLLKGNRVKVKVKRTSLKIGDECHVCFNSITGKIAHVLCDEDHSHVMVEPTSLPDPPTPEEIDQQGIIEVESFLGNQEGEDFGFWEFSREPES